MVVCLMVKRATIDTLRYTDFCRNRFPNDGAPEPKIIGIPVLFQQYFLLSVYT